MSVQTDPYTFVNGTVADALQVNARFDNLYSLQNGGIDSANMDLTASFAWTGTHSFTKSVSGSAYSLSLSNTSNTASSDAKQVISVGGSSAGNPFTNWNIAGVSDWVGGVDNTTTDSFKFQKNASISSDYVMQFNQGGTGGTNYLEVFNSFDTASSEAYIMARVAGSTAGDPAYRLQVNGITDWIMAIDNANGDILKIQKAAAVSSDFLISADQGGSGANNLFTAQNSNNAAASNAFIQAQVGGTSGGDPALILNIPSGTAWHVGNHNSDSDNFKIGTGSAVGTNTYFQIDTSGNITINGTTFLPTTDNATAIGSSSKSLSGIYSYEYDIPSSQTAKPRIKESSYASGGIEFVLTSGVSTRAISFNYAGATYTAGAPAATGYTNMVIGGTNYKILLAT